jgi:hypothetical protein
VSNSYSRRCNDRRVDPCCGGLRQGFRTGSDKAFRVAGVGAVQDLLALLDDFLGHAIMQHFQGQQGDAAVMVLAVARKRPGLAV